MKSNVFFISDTHFGHENIMKYCRRTAFMTHSELSLLDSSDRGEIDQRNVRISAESIRRMDSALIDNINAAVQENDILYHVGDAFWGHDLDYAREIRSRIRCKTIHHIWGNHDEPDVAQLFASSEKYAEILVEHQKIFLCHYPMRAWDKSHKGSWCLYGHVHGGTWDEDKYGLSKRDRNALTERFTDVINVYKNHLGLDTKTTEALELSQLLSQAVADHNCNQLTLDVGVDTHNYRPWSMAELRQELHPRIEHWTLRQAQESRDKLYARKLKA